MSGYPSAASTALLLFTLALPAAGEDLLRSFLAEEKAIWTSPFRINREHAPWLAAFGAGTAALIATDVRTSHEISESPARTRWGTRLSRFGGSYGVLAVSSALMVGGAAGHDTRLKRTGRRSAQAALHSFVLTYGIKLLTTRERPETGSGRGHFWSGYGDALRGDNSFPSGHSMGSWAVASVIAHEYADKPWVQGLAYGYASMISVSRVAAHRHYVGDVVVGAGAGYFLGRYIQRPAGQHSARPARHPVLASIQPRFDIARRSIGAGFTW